MVRVLLHHHCLRLVEYRVANAFCAYEIVCKHLTDIFKNLLAPHKGHRMRFINIQEFDLFIHFLNTVGAVSFNIAFRMHFARTNLFPITCATYQNTSMHLVRTIDSDSSI